MVSAAETAASIHGELSKIVQDLRAKNPESIRIEQLDKDLKGLLRPESERVEWLSTNPAVRNVAQKYLSSNTCSLAITHIPAPVALFGSLSPNVSESDVMTLTSMMTAASGEVSLSIAINMEPLASTPWEQGYEFADSAREKFQGLQSTDAVDIEGILTEIGVEVKEVALTDSKVRAVALCGPGWKPQIAVNTCCASNVTPPGRRFTLAHELCHLLFDQQSGVQLAIASGPWAPKRIEQRANAFAAMLLIPSRKLHEYDTHWTPEMITNTAQRFQVGRKTLINHLTNLALITHSESEDLEEDLLFRST